MFLIKLYHTAKFMVKTRRADIYVLGVTARKKDYKLGSGVCVKPILINILMPVSAKFIIIRNEYLSFKLYALTKFRLRTAFLLNVAMN